MELRDVPRSIPTWRTSFFPLIGSAPFFTGMIPRFRVRRDPGEEGARDALAIEGVLQAPGFLLVRDAGDLREDARHLGRDEDDERRGLHAAALEARVALLEARVEAGLERLRELLRLALTHVLEDAVQE